MRGSVRCRQGEFLGQVQRRGEKAGNPDSAKAIGSASKPAALYKERPCHDTNSKRSSTS